MPAIFVETPEGSRPPLYVGGYGVKSDPIPLFIQGYDNDYESTNWSPSKNLVDGYAQKALWQNIDLRNPINYDHPLNNGLEAWWLCLPQLHGGRTIRDLRNRFHLDLMNMDSSDWATGAGRPGGFGSLDFDGSNDHARGISWDRPTVTSSYTFSCWAYTTVTNRSFQIFACRGNPGYDDIEIYLADASSQGLTIAHNRTNSGTFTYVANDTKHADVSTTGNWGTLPKSRWVFLTVTFSNNTIKVYYDGIQKGNSPTNVAAPILYANWWYLGHSPNTALAGAWTPYFIGKMDDWRLYNRALSSDEVLELYKLSSRGNIQLLNRESPTFIYMGGSYDVPLFIRGHEHLDLSVAGYDSSSSSTPLYISGPILVESRATKESITDVNPKAPQQASWQNIDLRNPINSSSLLNKDLARWYLCLPQRRNKSLWSELVSNTNDELAAITTSEWKTSFNRPGGFASLYFNGSTQAMNYGRNAPRSSEYTVAMWVYCTLTRDFPTMFTMSNGFGGDDIEIYMADGGSGQGLTVAHNRNNGGTLSYASHNGNGGSIVANWGTLPKNQWVHLVVSYRQGACKVFFNGIQKGDTVTTLNPPLTNNKYISIGLTFNSAFYTSGRTPYFPGYIDDVRYYTRAISDQEAMMLYKDSSRGYPLSLNRGSMFSVADSEPDGTLFTSGIDVSTRSMPLFIRDNGVFGESSIPLIMEGHNFAGDGMWGGISLYAYSDESGNIYPRSMPLFHQGTNQESSIRNMNLYIDGSWHSSVKSTDLFINNSDSGVVESVNLFVSGDGVTDGYTPFSSNMNLFLNRDPANAISLIINGPGAPQSALFDMYILGGMTPTGSMDLSLPEVLGYLYNSNKLYIHGW